MSLEIINSETAKLDGKEMTVFKDPLALFHEIQNKLEIVGAKKFLSSPDEDIKKVRESMAGFFFGVGINKATNKHWWLMQPKDTFPDFIFMTVSDTPINIFLEPVELVEIPSFCPTLDEAEQIVQKKLQKGYPKKSCSLLIFFNHAQSQEWITPLTARLKNDTFIAIWTVHLLFKGKENPYCSVVTKIKPDPIFRTEASFNDPGLYHHDLSGFTEKRKEAGKTIIKFKPEFANKFTKELMKLKLKVAKQDKP